MLVRCRDAGDPTPPRTFARPLNIEMVASITQRRAVPQRQLQGSSRGTNRNVVLGCPESLARPIFRDPAGSSSPALDRPAPWVGGYRQGVAQWGSLARAWFLRLLSCQQGRKQGQCQPTSPTGLQPQIPSRLLWSAGSVGRRHRPRPVAALGWGSRTAWTATNRSCQPCGQGRGGQVLGLDSGIAPQAIRKRAQSWCSATAGTSDDPQLSWGNGIRRRG